MPDQSAGLNARQDASSAEWERPITADFYRSPSGEWVYKWSDERLVLKDGPTDGG